jgi:HSP20 family molecular chaperone IbpA
LTEKGREQKRRGLEEQERKRRGGGVAGNVLRELGDVIPGLGKMLEGLEDSEDFQRRLEAINKEVDKRLKETPLKKAEEGEIGRGSIPGRSTISRMKKGFSIETLGHEKPLAKKQTRRLYHKEEKAEKEISVDVFEEDEHLKIIAELPGVEEKDIEIQLKEEKLTISADTPYRRYHKEMTLPCPVQGKPEASYRNGVLEIELQKEV